MPRTANHTSSRMALRIRPRDKATILRATALEETDLTEFVIRTALREAQAVIRRTERVKLTRRDSRRVLDLLENPPVPNARLRAAAHALPGRA